MKRFWLKMTLTSFIIVFSSALHSQAQSKVNIFLDYHYRLGLYEIHKPYNISRKESKMYGNSIHLSVLYNITKQISAGIGMGADRYENPSYNTFPLFASAHYSPLKKHTNFYTYTNVGYAIVGKQETYKGAMWDLGVGYKKMFRRHFGLNFQVGYNWKQFQNVPSYVMIEDAMLPSRNDNTRSSISLGLGLIF